MRKDRIASLNNVVQKSGKKYKKKEESTEKYGIGAKKSDYYLFSTDYINVSVIIN